MPLSHRYQIYIRKPDAAEELLVHEGDHFESAVRDWQDCVKRSQGKWTNHVFLNKSVELYDHGMLIRNYEGKQDAPR